VSVASACNECEELYLLLRYVCNGCVFWGVVLGLFVIVVGVLVGLWVLFLLSCVLCVLFGCCGVRVRGSARDRVYVSGGGRSGLGV
jgi:hypothetical protein